MLFLPDENQEIHEPHVWNYCYIGSRDKESTVIFPRLSQFMFIIFVPTFPRPH